MAFTKLNSFSKKPSDMPDIPSPSMTPDDIRSLWETPLDELLGKQSDLVDELNGTKWVDEPKLGDSSVSRRTIQAGAVGTNEIDPSIMNQPTTAIGVQAKFDSIDSQLAEHANNLKSKFINVMYPPAPLTAAKGDGITNDYGAIQGCINYFSGNGGVLYFPQPSNFYLTKSAVTLINSNISSFGTLSLIGESQLNTIIKLDNNTATGALIYDNGTKRIDVSGCSSTSGSNIITTSGNFNTAGLEVGMTVHMSFLPDTATITAINNDTQITVNKNATQSVSGATAMFYKLVTNTHRLKITDLYIQNTHSNTQFSSWHPGTGLVLKGTHDSIFDHIRIDGFTKGLYNMGGYVNQFNTVNTNSCYDGYVLEYACFGTNIIKPVASGIGDNNGGYPIKIINTGSIKIDNIVMENNKRGLLLEGVHGFDIGGGNIESTNYAYPIEIKGMENIDPSDDKFWTSGGQIRGFRFYESLGILFKDGCADIDFMNNEFVGSPTSFTVGAASCINSTSNYNYMKNIRYGNNKYYVGGEPNRHILSGTLAAAQSFTENGKRYSSSIPYYGKFWKVGDEVLNSAPAASGFRGWICVTASNGTSDGSAVWKTFGAIGA